MKPRAFGHATLAAVLALTTAAPAWAAPRGSNIRPEIGTDEGGLWSVSDKAEAQAKASGELDRDEALTAYVRELGCKVAADYCADIRAYVFDRPYFNAAMAPNGYMEVWSGLLLRVEDEAELAFVLGHEISHFAENHSVETWRAAKARSNAAMIVSMVAGAAGVGFIGNLAYLGAMASLFSFSRENEMEADRLGFERATAAGYDPGAGASLWRYLSSETEQSSFEKTRKSQARPSIFNTHPITSERIAALQALAAGKPGVERTGRARHRAMIRPHLGEWLRDDLRRRDFGQTLHLIDHLGAGGEDLGVLGFYRGETYRLRRGDGDLPKARAAYEEATAHPDAPDAAWRELGDAWMRESQPAKARAAYETYIARAPQAPDRWLVEASLKKLLENSGT